MSRSSLATQTESRLTTVDIIAAELACKETLENSWKWKYIVLLSWWRFMFCGCVCVCVTGDICLWWIFQPHDFWCVGRHNHTHTARSIAACPGLLYKLFTRLNYILTKTENLDELVRSAFLGAQCPCHRSRICPSSSTMSSYCFYNRGLVV